MAGDFGLVVSPRLLHELQTVLAREKFRRHFTYEEATEYVSWLHHEAQVVRDPAESVVYRVVDADPDDEYLVGLAGTLEGASYLVSVAPPAGPARRGGQGRQRHRAGPHPDPQGVFARVGASGLGDLASPADFQERGKTNFLPTKRHARTEQLMAGFLPETSTSAARRAGRHCPRSP